MSAPRTMFEKIWDDHVVYAEPGKQTILYIDLHLVHEVTSPQAFEGLRLAGRKVRRPELTRRHARPQRPDDRPQPADRRSDLEAADRHAAQQLPRVRHHALRPGRLRSRASSTSSARSWATRSRA